MGILVQSPILLYRDNKSAIKIVSNPVFYERIEHIEIDTHYICQSRLLKIVELSYVSITAQLLTSSTRLTDSDTQISQKSQLHYLLTRKNLVPIYSCVHAGPPHAPRFKATVEFDGQVFESQQFYKTLKEAEHDAAKVALLALPPEESLQPKDESGFYKNLLQELAQKEGLSLPVYKTIRNGESHIPTFSSTVEIGGESFDGDAAKTKKLAEMSVAKVAYCQLQEQMAGFKIVASETLFGDREADSAGETADHGSSHTVHPPKMVSTVLADVEDSVDSTSSEDGSAESSLGSSHLHTVKVYPRKPDMVLPKGAVLLPFSDDKWAAVDLDFSNDGGDL